jgi:hypothetical protein
MNAAFGLRFAAAFFAISSPCEGRPLGRPVWLHSIMNTSFPLYQLCFQRRTA